ncbi:MAG: cell division protein FtsL [Gimesia chilikensis]
MLAMLCGKWSLGMLWVAVLVSALAVVWATNETRLHTSQLLSLQAEANNLLVSHGQLQLQERALTSAAGVERLATNRLGLKFPEANEIGVLLP